MPPTAGKRDSEDKPREGSAAEPAVAQSDEPAAAAEAAAAAAPEAAAPVSSALDPEAPAFEPDLGVEKSELSSLAAGADRYEQRMSKLGGTPSMNLAAGSEEEAAPAVVEKSHISSLASGADRYERNMRHLVGQYSMRPPPLGQQSEGTPPEAAEASGKRAPADAAEAESSPSAKSSYSPMAMLGAAGAGIAAVGAAAAAAIKHSLTPEPKEQQPQQQEQSAPATEQAVPPTSLAAGADARHAALASLGNTPEDTLQRQRQLPAEASAAEAQVPPAADIIGSEPEFGGLAAGADTADAGVSTMREGGEDSAAQAPPRHQPPLQVHSVASSVLHTCQHRANRPSRASLRSACASTMKLPAWCSLHVTWAGCHDLDCAGPARGSRQRQRLGHRHSGLAAPRCTADQDVLPGLGCCLTRCVHNMRRAFCPLLCLFMFLAFCAADFSSQCLGTHAKSVFAYACAAAPTA